MILKFVLYFVLFYMAFKVAGKLFSPATNKRDTFSKKDKGPSVSSDSDLIGKEREEMVLDEVCGSYVAKSMALRLDAGSGTEAERFFCSEECRGKFIETKNKKH
ncbi:MAG: hypothetical protein KAT46_07660 [Deltaproteobacteria bacterium]|nr:hypothetical protein [Deltaproteobacteria bacterium]